MDILVNNAGIGTAVPGFDRGRPPQFRQVIDLNLSGCYWMAQAYGEGDKTGWRKRSSTSRASSRSRPQDLPQAAYKGSKAGLLGLTRDLAQQWTNRERSRVNAV